MGGTNVDTGGGKGGGGSQGTPGSSGQGPLQLPTAATMPNTLAAQSRLLPVAYGTVKAIPYLIEAQPPSSRQPPPWSGSTYYHGSIVASDGGVWRCLKAGTAANAPTGQGVAPTAWATSQTFALNAIRQNGGNVYQCTKAGAGATLGTGPAGTGTQIFDAAAQWMYLGPLPFPVVNTPDGLWWQYIQQLPYPFYGQFLLGALCEGEVQGGVSLFFDKERYATFSATALGKGIFLLTGPDAANQVPTFGDAAGYQHTALIEPVDATANAGIPTGTQKETPAIAVELQAVMFGSAVADVNPADIINDILTHARRGVAWPSSRVGATVTGTAAGDYRVYCDAAGFRFSMYIDKQRTALEILADILNATNSDAIWSGGALKIVPLGDQPIASPVYGAAGYVPANAAQYNLGEVDLLGPVEVRREDDADTFNDFPVEYIDRSMVYQANVVEDPDQTDIDKRGGMKRASTLALPVIFPDGKAPIMLSRIYAQRSLYNRNTYTLRLPWRYLLLEPNDVVTVSDFVLGLSQVPMRIVSMREGADFTWEATAEDYPQGVAASTAYAPQAGDGYKPNAAGTGASNIPTSFGTGALTSKTGDNLWPNPTSENSAPSGTPVGNDGGNPEWDYRSDVTARNGAWCRLLAATSNPNGVAIRLDVRFACLQDEIVQLSAWETIISTLAHSITPNIRVTFYNSSGTSLLNLQNSGIQAVGTNDGIWHKLTVNGRAPANTVYAVASLVVNGNGIDAGNPSVVFDDILLKRFPPAGPVGGIVTLAGVGGAPACDCTAGDQFIYSSTGNPGIPAPTNAFTGQNITIKVKNVSGGAIVTAWNGVFKLSAWVDPANGFSRSITFHYDGTNFVEISRTPNDVAN